MRFNHFLFLGIFFFISNSATAQNFRYGLKVGGDLVNAHFVKKAPFRSDNRKSIVSFNANVVLEYLGGNNIGFTMEPGFIRKGFGYSNSYAADEFIKEYANYIQMPLLFDYHLTDKLAFSVGPDFAIYLNKKGRFSPNEKFEVSAVIGGKYSLSEHIDMGLRYGHGLTPTVNINLTDADGASIGKLCDFNQYLQLSFAYKI